MDKLENENAELRMSLDAAVGAWTDDKQMTGTLNKQNMFAIEPKCILQFNLRFDIFKTLFCFLLFSRDYFLGHYQWVLGFSNTWATNNLELSTNQPRRPL